jgi:hypothetical protein
MFLLAALMLHPVPSDSMQQVLFVKDPAFTGALSCVVADGSAARMYATPDVRRIRAVPRAG